jgi:hypothetical protein
VNRSAQRGADAGAVESSDSCSRRSSAAKGKTSLTAFTNFKKLWGAPCLAVSFNFGN